MAKVANWVSVLLDQINVELKTPLLFVLDEIHKISGWEEYVIDLSRNPNWKVIVSGSSSKLLKHDIATELRGKAVSSTLYPLSFSEFLRFKNFKYDYKSTKGQAKENLILTYNQEKDFQAEGVTVRARPVWRWLLEGW